MFIDFVSDMCVDLRNFPNIFIDFRSRRGRRRRRLFAVLPTLVRPIPLLNIWIDAVSDV